MESKGPNTFQQQQSSRLQADDVLRYISEKVFVTTPSSYYANYPKWPGLVGLEIEMLPLVKGNAFPPILAKRNQALEDALITASKNAGWQTHYDDDPANKNKILSIDLGEQDQITFEPGGQLEISTKPYPCLTQAVERLSHLQNMLDQGLEQNGLEITQIGMNPWYSPKEIGLQIPKARYHAMTEYFGNINAGVGLRMMRQTCTVQVNLDFGPDESTLAKRYLAAQVLAPFAGAIFAFSPYCDGKLTEFRSMRIDVWQKIDRGRTGFPKHLNEIAQRLDQASCVQGYFELFMNSPVVFVTGLHYEVPERTLTFKDWLTHGYKGIFPNYDDLKTCLSLLFPEVRARGFLELRSIDCQARPWQIVPAVFYTALLYDEQSLNSLVSWADEFLRKNSLEETWAKARYGLREADLAAHVQHIMELAISGFDRLPSCFHGQRAKERLVAFYQNFTELGVTPADALIKKCKKNGVRVPGIAELNALNDEWT